MHDALPYNVVEIENIIVSVQKIAITIVYNNT